MRKFLHFFWKLLKMVAEWVSHLSVSRKNPSSYREKKTPRLWLISYEWWKENEFHWMSVGTRFLPAQTPHIKWIRIHDIQCPLNRNFPTVSGRWPIEEKKRKRGESSHAMHERITICTCVLIDSNYYVWIWCEKSDPTKLSLTSFIS